MPKDALWAESLVPDRRSEKQESKQGGRFGKPLGKSANRLQMIMMTKFRNEDVS